MYQILANSSSFGCVEFDGCSKKYKKAMEYRKNYGFYSKWLQFEQKNGDYTQILNVYLMATDNLKSVNDLRDIQDMFNSRMVRDRKVSKSAEPVVEDGIEQSEYLNRVDKVINRKISNADCEYYELQEMKHQPKEFYVEKKGTVEDIANILGNLTLGPIEVKKEPIIIEDDFHYSIKLKEHNKPARQVRGVEMGTAGSTVTVLTPVKAKKKQQLGFNV